MINETILAQLEQDLITLVERCKSGEIHAVDAIDRYHELVDAAEENMDMSLLTQEQAERIHPYYDQLTEMEDAFVKSVLAGVTE